MKRLTVNNSGQILILSALAIVIIVISTVTYVYQLTHYPFIKDSPASSTSFITNIEVETQNLLTKMLAQISHSEATTTLPSILAQWSNFVTHNYYQGHCTFQWILPETSLYSQGLALSWGTDGIGISSAQLIMMMNLTGEDTVNMIHQITITTQLSLNYSVNVIAEDNQQVIVTATLYDESGPTSANDIVIYYHNASGWHDARVLSTYHLTHNYAGTYTAIFYHSSIDRLSLQCTDRRGIYVQANATQSPL